ncbi:hypothetical protein [Streptomyces griseus]|uniref:hypothetical protein n=1 Tax=Streptomyces griseus TaxID=1911 RepID=UPI003701E21F
MSADVWIDPALPPTAPVPAPAADVLADASSLPPQSAASTPAARVILDGTPAPPASSGPRRTRCSAR